LFLVLVRIVGHDDRFIIWVQISWTFETVLRRVLDQLYHLAPLYARFKLEPMFFSKARPESMDHDPLVGIPPMSRVIEIFGRGELIVDGLLELYLYLGKILLLLFYIYNYV
jgi:hypothetical protein